MILAVMDVNVMVSAVIGPLGHSRRIISAWEDGAFSSITAPGIIAEVESKLQLPRIARRFVISDDDRRWIAGLLQTQSQVIDVPPSECLVVTGDPEDDYVLATTRLSKAAYLVTGDHGLLALTQYAEARIVTPRDFLDLLPSST